MNMKHWAMASAMALLLAGTARAEGPVTDWHMFGRDVLKQLIEINSNMPMGRPASPMPLPTG